MRREISCLKWSPRSLVFPFLSKEGVAWGKQINQPLQRVAKQVPCAFIALGSLAAIVMFAKPNLQSSAAG